MENKDVPKSPWKGPFYFAPIDSRLRLKKSGGIGFGLNFGNQVSWLLPAVVVLMTVAVIWIKMR